MQTSSDEGSKLNGSVDLLAQAMRRAVTQAVQEASGPVRTEVKVMRNEMHDMENQLNKRIDMTNENVQSQLGQHRKDVADDMRQIVKGDRPE